MAFLNPSSIVLLVGVAAALGQNRSLSGANHVNAMAGLDGKIYAGTNAGLFASGDEGRTWTKVPGVDMQVARLAVFGGKLLAATESWLFRMGADGTWDRIASGGDSLVFSSLRLVGNTLEATTWDTRWISMDGSHWSRGPISLALNRPVALAAGPQGHLYAFTNQGHFISKDGGAGWEPRPPYFSGDGLWDVQAAFASDGETVYYCPGDGRVYRTPGGDSLFSPAPGKGRPRFGVIGKYLLVGYLGGMSRSSDHGASFQSAGQGLGSGQTLQLSSGSVSVFAQQTDGIYRSQDSGTTWSKILSGTWNDPCLATAGREIYVSQGTRLYHSSDNGDSWTWVENATHEISGENNTLAITSRGLVHHGGGAVWFTGNQGQNWGLWTTPPGPNGARTMTAVGDRIYVSPDTGIFVSDDFGKNWRRPDSAPVPRDIGGMVSRGEDIYVSRGSEIYHSANGGKTWATLNRSGLPERTITSMAWAGDTLFAGLATQGENSVYFSKGPGALWQPAAGVSHQPVQSMHAVAGRLLVGSPTVLVAVSSPSSGVWGGFAVAGVSNVSGFFQAGSRLYAYSSGNGVFASSDGGLTWDSFLLDMTGYDITTLAVMDNLYIGTVREGLFARAGQTDWTRESPVWRGPGMRSMVTDGSFLFAAMDAGTIIRVRREHPQTRAGRIPVSRNFLQGLALDGGNIFAATDSGLFAAAAPGPDSGFSWRLLRAGRGLAVAVRGQNLALVGPGYLLLSRDQGKTFPDTLKSTQYGTGANPLGFTDAGDLYIGTGAGLEVVRNADRKTELSVACGKVAALANRDGVWAVSGDAGLFVSREAGFWSEIPTELKPALALALSGDTLFAGSGRRLESISLGSASGRLGRGPRGKPAPGVQLAGFRSAEGLGIRYVMSRPGRITLTLLCMDGRSLRLLTGAPRQAGQHQVLLPQGSGLRGPLWYYLEARNKAGEGSGAASIQSGWLGVP